MISIFFECRLMFITCKKDHIRVYKVSMGKKKNDREKQKYFTKNKKLIFCNRIHMRILGDPYSYHSNLICYKRRDHCMPKV